MAETVLTMFVYLLFIVMIVAGIELGIALFQFIKDIPAIRKIIWSVREERGKNYHNLHNLSS